MTVWENIYQDYKKGKAPWATLNGVLHPSFIKFVKKSRFELKSVLDLGCGDGKYLKFLRQFGFKTSGIDSSKTAIKMTKENLGDNSFVKAVDFYKYDIPVGKFDFIISVKAIHHGKKSQVVKLINKIYKSLPPKGKIFITLPSSSNISNWKSFKIRRTINLARGESIPLSGPEKGLIHSFYTKNEVKEMFKDFHYSNIYRDKRGQWIITGAK